MILRPKRRGRSSIGRAPRLQRGGCRFGPGRLHFPSYSVFPDDESDEPLSIRGEYERLGPEAFYRLHGRDYRNPHEDSISLTLSRAAKRWLPDLSHVLDLA